MRAQPVLLERSKHSPVLRPETEKEPWPTRQKGISETRITGQGLLRSGGSFPTGSVDSDK